MEQIVTELKRTCSLYNHAASSPSANKCIAPPAAVPQQLDEVANCLESMRSIYSLTLAVVNRGIEYTKLSAGCPIIPSKQWVVLSSEITKSIRIVQAITSVNIQVKWIPTTEYSKQVNNDNVDSSLLRLYTDKQWLEESLLCILTNAIKFSNHKDIQVIVSFTTSTAQIAVIDEGILLTPKQLDAFFTFAPHHQHGLGQYAGGIGLGLYTLAKRIEAVGGIYGVRNRADGIPGTEVWIRLPLGNDTPPHNRTIIIPDTINTSPSLPPMIVTSCSSTPTRKQERSPLFSAAKRSSYTAMTTTNPLEKKNSSFSRPRGLSLGNHNSMDADISTNVISPRIRCASESIDLFSSSSHHYPNHKRHHILIVDDSTAILKMLTMMFRKQGYVVSTAMHGQAAVERMQLHFSSMKTQLNDITSRSPTDQEPSIDIILMDVQMPIMNGLDAIRCIRQMEEEYRRLSVSSSSVVLFEHEKSEILPEYSWKFAATTTTTTTQSVSKSFSQRYFDRVHSNTKEENELMEATTTGSCQYDYMYSPLQIIAMSANGEVTCCQEATCFGANAFISKPFTMEVFQGTLNSLNK